MKNKIMTVALLILGLATTAQANIILDVLVDQRVRIEKAQRYGKISNWEARNLIQEQARIENAILNAERDGIVTKREYKRIGKLQRIADRNIWAATSINNRVYQNAYNNSACVPYQGRTNRRPVVTKKPPKRIQTRSVRRN